MSAGAAAVDASRAGHVASLERVATRSRAHLAVFWITGLYAVLFAAAAVARHASFGSGRYDLGNMVQAIWSTSQGRLLETTEMTRALQFSRLGVHVEPILFVFAPIWRVFPSPSVLVVTQAVVLSLGALPVFWLARKHLASEHYAGRFAVAYLLFPATQWNALGDFHASALAIPFFLFAIWYLDEERFLAFLPFAVLAASTKEEMPLLVAWLGVWFAVRSRRWTAGLATAAVGAVWFVVAFVVVRGHFALHGVDQVKTRYSWLGGSDGVGFGDLLAAPVSFAGTLELRDAVYLGLVLVPLLFLWLGEPLLALGALPTLAVNVSSLAWQQTSISNWYMAGVLPFLLAASIIGAGRVRHRAPALSFAVVACAAVLAVGSPLWHLPTYVAQLSDAHQAPRRAALELIPAGEPVSATNALAAHLSNRRHVYVFPVIGGARWVVIDSGDAFDPIHDRHIPIAERGASLRTAAAVFARQPGWERVYTRDGVSVYRRAPG